MTPVRLEPAALQSRVKHSTTEPLRSLQNVLYLGVLVLFVMCTLGFMFCLSCARVTLTDTVKSNLSGHSKKNTKIGFQDRLLLNAGQKRSTL